MTCYMPSGTLNSILHTVWSLVYVVRYSSNNDLRLISEGSCQVRRGVGGHVDWSTADRSWVIAAERHNGTQLQGLHCNSVEWMNDSFKVCTATVLNEWMIVLRSALQVLIEWMTVLFPCDQKLAESQFSPTHASTKRKNGWTKT